MLNNMSGLDLRIPQRVHPDGAKPQFGDGTYGLHLVIAPAGKSAASTNMKVEANRLAPELVHELPLDSFPSDAMSMSQTLRLDATTAPKSGSLSGSLVVPTMPPASYIKVQLSGLAKLNSGDGRIGVKLLLGKSDGSQYMLSWVPDCITVLPGWLEKSSNLRTTCQLPFWEAL